MVDIQTGGDSGDDSGHSEVVRTTTAAGAANQVSEALVGCFWVESVQVNRPSINDCNDSIGLLVRRLRRLGGVSPFRWGSTRTEQKAARNCQKGHGWQ